MKIPSLTSVGVEDKLLVLVLSLELAGLVPSVGLEGAVQSQLKSGHQLLVVHSGADRDVSVPLLSYLESVLLDGHAIDGAANLAPVNDGVPSRSELQPSRWCPSSRPL